MLTEEEKVDCRRHMGYGNVQEAATFVLGVPAGVQTQFLIEGAMQKILASAEPMLRRYVAALNAIECQVEGDTENLAANKIGSIEINQKEFEQLLQRYRYWQGNLANLLQIPVNPFDQRPLLGSGYAGNTGVNVPVTS